LNAGFTVTANLFLFVTFPYWLRRHAFFDVQSAAAAAPKTVFGPQSKG
jgi:hypothetical protein